MGIIGGVFQYVSLVQDMGIAPSQRSVHLFPPPPAQLAHLTRSGEDDRHKMDIALRLTERIESWFGTESIRKSATLTSLFHSRFGGTVPGPGGMGIKVSPPIHYHPH